jgi:DNA-binding response OmpR family regulator
MTVNRLPDPEPLQALVVDDEAGIRSLIATALRREGFVCDAAASVLEATQYLATRRYQLVITDLAIPNRNGHSFAVELLGMPDRPVVVVLTGVLEPRIAKDLIARGIDDVVFKPVQVLMFAAKMRSLTERRLQPGLEPAPQLTSRPQASLPPPRQTRSSQLGRMRRISQEVLDDHLRNVSRIPTVSRAAIEVFKLTSSADSSCQQIAAAVQREPALIADIMRLANSSFSTRPSKDQQCRAGGRATRTKAGWRTGSDHRGIRQYHSGKGPLFSPGADLEEVPGCGNLPGDALGTSQERPLAGGTILCGRAAAGGKSLARFRISRNLRGAQTLAHV